MIINRQNHFREVSYLYLALFSRKVTVMANPVQNLPASILETADGIVPQQMRQHQQQQQQQHYANHNLQPSQSPYQQVFYEPSPSSLNSAQRQHLPHSNYNHEQPQQVNSPTNNTVQYPPQQPQAGSSAAVDGQQFSQYHAHGHGLPQQQQRYPGQPHHPQQQQRQQQQQQVYHHVQGHSVIQSGAQYVAQPQRGYRGALPTHAQHQHLQPHIEQVFCEEVVQTTTDEENGMRMRPHANHPTSLHYQQHFAPQQQQQQQQQQHQQNVYYEPHPRQQLQQHQPQIIRPIQRHSNLQHHDPSRMAHDGGFVSSGGRQYQQHPQQHIQTYSKMDAGGEQNLRSYVVPSPEAFQRPSSGQGQYLPAVGSTCTIVTTTPPPVEEEVDVYDFSSGNEDADESSISTSAPSAYAPGVTLPPQSPYDGRLRKKRISSAVPALEEEDDEEETSPTGSSHSTSPSGPRRTIQLRELSMKSASATDQGRADPATSAISPTTIPHVKKSRKQSLPSTSARETIVLKAHLQAPPKKVAKEKDPKALASNRAKKEESARNLQVDKELASNAHVQTVQRISTMEGWSRMNQWLKATERANNVEKLKSLLKQCIEANITMELLVMNDTPKFIMQLSKNSKDKDVSEMASTLVSKWKKVIKVGDAAKMAESPSAAASKEKEQKSVKHSASVSPKHNSAKSSASPKSGSEECKDEPSSSATSSSSSAKEAPAAPVSRPKTVKAKISKPRSTGLEGDDGNKTSTSTAPKRRQIGPPTTTPSTTTAKPSTANTTAKRAAKQMDTSILGDILAASNVPPKIQTSKRSVMLSDSFMDALEDHAPKKPKIVRKKVASTTSAIGSGGGLYSDTSKNLASSRRESADAAVASGPAANIVDEYMARRKICFADEKGGRLVSVKFFEIEQGERMNVTKMSSEDMKHCEMQQERTLIREKKGFHFSTSMPMPPGFGNFRQSGYSTSSSPWKLFVVDGVEDMVERGLNSESKLIEMRRQNTVMEAFYDAYTSMQISEIDDCDNQRGMSVAPPKIIPLDAILSPAPQELRMEPMLVLPPLPVVTSSLLPVLPPSSSPHISATSIITQLPLPFSSSMAPFADSPRSPIVSNSPTDVTPVQREISPMEQNQITSKKDQSPAELEDTTRMEQDFTPAEPQSPPTDDDDMEDTDIRCIPSERQMDSSPPAVLNNESTAATADSTINSTNNTTSAGEGGGMADMQAILSKLRNSGLMGTANWAEILKKVGNQ